MPYRRVTGNTVTARSVTRAFLGAVCIGIGAGAMIRASIGVTPWDVLTTAVSRHADVTVGVAGAVLTAAVLAGCAPFGRLPGWGNVVTAVGVSGAVDVTMAALGEPAALAARVPLYALGVVVVCLGIGLVVRADIGVGPLEMVMLVATDRSVPLVAARVAIEAVTLALGWALGGALGVGTALFALSAGPLISLFLRLQRPVSLPA